MMTVISMEADEEKKKRKRVEVWGEIVFYGKTCLVQACP